MSCPNTKIYFDETYPSLLGQKLLGQHRDGSFTDVSIETAGGILHVHRVVLTADSAFWTAMFKGGFTEEANKTISLSNISADIFGMMCNQNNDTSV